MVAIRSGMLWGFAGLAIFALLTLLQLYGLNLLAVFVAGIAAGHMAVTGRRRSSGVGPGLTAGLIGGMVLLVGSFFVGILIVTLLRSEALGWAIGIPFITWIPIVGDTVDTVTGYADPWLRGGGLVLGSCLGLVNLVLMAAGGAIGGVVGRH